MNAKNVLGKILTLLSIESGEVHFTEAKSADGAILSSPTFDLNEDVEEVHEDGSKTPAKDGEYTITLTDESGNENIIRIEVKDGKIVERANEEEEKNEPSEEEDMEETPMDQTSTVDGDVNMAKDYVKAPKGLETDEAKALPQTTDEDPRNRVGTDSDDKKDPIISLSYRIQELEEALAEVKLKVGELTSREDIDHKEAQETKKESDIKLEDEVDVPKLDGAPVEMSAERVNLSAKKTNKNVEGNYQSSFLAKLYK